MIVEKDAGRAKPTGDLLAMYHVIYSHEGFEESAQALLRLVKRAQETQPGKPEARS